MSFSKNGIFTFAPSSRFPGWTGRVKIFLCLKFILITFLLSGCSSSGDLSKDYSTINKQVKAIDKKISSINPVQLTMGDGADLTAYYENGVLQKIHIERPMQGGQETRDCYFKNWRLIYLADRKFFLDMPNQNNTEKNSYYFKDDSLIGWEKPGDDEVTYSKSKEFKDKENELLLEVEQYLLLIQ